MQRFIFLSALALTCYVATVSGHGRLLEPPSRSSMFRFAYSDPMLFPYRSIIQPNYDDNGLNCGGKQVQIDNDGNCGVCGDSYTADVKENEAGGKYALGIITRNYQMGDIVDVTIEITAEHKGYFEFRLCPWNNINLPITHECLNQHLLTYENGDTKWYLPEDSSQAKGLHELKVRLPDDVTCEQCVLQWRYRTGNSWGYENGQQGLGLSQQEEFYGCSDVAIIGKETDISKTSTLTVAKTTTTAKTTPAATRTTSLTSITDQQKKTTMSGIATNKSIDVTTTNIDDTTSVSVHATSLMDSASLDQDVTSSASMTSAIYQVVNAPEVNFYPDIDCSQEILGQPIFRDCHSFYICAFAQYDPYVFGCPESTVCDPRNAKCDHPYNVIQPCNSL